MIGVALKEWAVICDLLVAGEQTILLRKGGIEEADGPGRFRLETPRFALFPAWLHQLPERIKPQWRHQVEHFEAEPAEITIRGVAVAEHIWQVPSRVALDPLDDLHAWQPEHLDMRWNYKPKEPLYLLALRVERLTAERTIPNNPHYAGCKSWVNLEPTDAVDATGATPVLSDADFAAIVARIDKAMR